MPRGAGVAGEGRLRPYLHYRGLSMAGIKGSGKDRKYLSKVYGFRERIKKAGKRGH